MEEYKGKTLEVDQGLGFIRLIDYMGDEAAIVQAARVSYGAGTKTARDDRALLRYMLSHDHTSPFEMCEIKLHVKAPIFIARQWMRHRTANVNEISARYSEMDQEFWFPDELRLQSTTNKQGSEGKLEAEVQGPLLSTIKTAAGCASEIYGHLLEQGVAREQARMVMPLNAFTEWYWKIDLHNLLGFLEKRSSPEAQPEMQEFAKALAMLVEAWVPNVWQAFLDYRLGSFKLSALALAVVRARLAGRHISFPDSGLSLREWNTLNTVMES